MKIKLSPNFDFDIEPLVGRYRIWNWRIWNWLKYSWWKFMLATIRQFDDFDCRIIMMVTFSPNRIIHQHLKSATSQNSQYYKPPPIANYPSGNQPLDHSEALSSHVINFNTISHPQTIWVILYMARIINPIFLKWEICKYDISYVTHIIE